MSKYFKSFSELFMSRSPYWYKATMVLFLFLNPIVYLAAGQFIAGWLILLEFLFILVFALHAYPLFSGGLLALEVLLMKLILPSSVIKEVISNIDVIMLLMFLVPAIYFMKPLLLWFFIRIFSRIENKVALSLIFLVAGAFLSAWLDALTVTAVIIAVCAAVKDLENQVRAVDADNSQEFNGFLRNLCIHGAIGTALGGVATLIGEPQNILIGHYAGWQFNKFYLMMAKFSIPIQFAGILTCFVLEKFKLRMFGFGYQLPLQTRGFLRDYFSQQSFKSDPKQKINLIIIGSLFLCMILALSFQIAPIGVIGLGLLICLPVLTGQADEEKIAKAFAEPMLFAGLLVVFFVIVAMIESLGLFNPVAHWALSFSPNGQMYSFFIATGILSAISDNVFVATVYIHQAFNALTQGIIDQAQFEQLARVINVGTNIFSVATPNGQAAFLFLLTSQLAARIKLSYTRMLIMTIPYTIVLVLTALLCI